MKHWWVSLAVRERYTLLVGAFFVLGALGYAILWRPLDRGITLNRVRVTQLKSDLQWMQAAAAKMRSLQASGQGHRVAVPGPLAVAVDASVRQHGLEKAVTRLEVQGKGTVGVSLSSVGFDALLRWLGDLQRQGIAIGRLDLTPVGLGRVHGTLRLVRAGPR